MFHMERRSRDTLFIIIIMLNRMLVSAEVDRVLVCAEYSAENILAGVGDGRGGGSDLCRT